MADVPPTRPTRVRWLIFALACAVSWLLYLHRYAWGVVRPAVQSEYGLSDVELGGLKQGRGWEGVFLAVAGAYLVAALCWLVIDCTRALVEGEETPGRGVTSDPPAPTQE